MEITEIEEVEIEITDEQLDFLTRELGLTFEDLENLDDDGWEKVYNDCADIEIKESMETIRTKRPNVAGLHLKSWTCCPCNSLPLVKCQRFFIAQL